MISKLLPLFPRHQVYCEAFGGGASLLFAKSPSPVEVYNDLDGSVVNLFRCLQDKSQFAELQQKLEYTLYSRAEFARAIEILNTKEAAPVERAWAKFVSHNQGFSGKAFHGSNWGRVFTSSSGMAGTTSMWSTRLSMLSDFHRRLLRVQIDCNDALKILKYWDTQDTLFYLDPPYVADTRKDTSVYNCEMADTSHSELITLIKTLHGKVILSGYGNGIYDELTESGWYRLDFETACHAAGKTRSSSLQGKGSTLAKVPRTECVWMNFKSESHVFKRKRQIDWLQSK